MEVHSSSSPSQIKNGDVGNHVSKIFELINKKKPNLL